jgi:NIPSNAP protein
MSRATVFITPLVLLIVATAFAPAARAADPRVFELRTYTTADGRLDALNARFREHTIALFERHGMQVIGFWTPTAADGANTLVYLLAYPSAAAREASWKAFTDDPEWKKVREESERDGKIVLKVDSKMLAPTDYSPMK